MVKRRVHWERAKIEKKREEGGKVYKGDNAFVVHMNYYIPCIPLCSATRFFYEVWYDKEPGMIYCCTHKGTLKKNHSTKSQII